MSFRFVALSTHQLSDVIPVSSPLSVHKPLHITAASCSGAKDTEPNKHEHLLLAGLLYINQKVISTSTSTPTSPNQIIRQVPVFLRSGFLGVFIGFDEKVDNYGIDICTPQNVQQKKNEPSLVHDANTKDITVEFKSFDINYVQPMHLNLIKNNILPNSVSEQTEAKSSLFFISNSIISNLGTLRDHFVGFLVLASSKWLIFLDNGHLCLKLNTFESLLTDFSIWIDSMYRIRLGNFDLNSKKNVVYFSMLKIVLPRTFEYDFTFSQDLNSNIGPAGCATSAEKLELEKYRHRLCQLNPEHRALMEKEALNYEQLELQLVNSILDNNKLVREKKKLELQQQYDNKLKEIDCIFSSKQQVEIDELKKSFSMKTKSETTNALKAIEADADFDINNFKNRLITEATEEVKLIWQKCNASIEEYSKIRNEARQKDLIELKMKMEIEIKQKEKHIIENIKQEKEKETVEAALDAKQAIANLNAQHDNVLTKEVDNKKLLLKKEFESKKARINKEFSKERSEIEEMMEKLSITIKSKSLKRK